MTLKKNRFGAGLAHLGAALYTSRWMWAWVLVSLLLLAVVTALNPAKFGGYLWIVSKLAGAAVVGFGVDAGGFPGQAPAELDGIERAMAQTRRATLIAAAMIAAGLMP